MNELTLTPDANFLRVAYEENAHEPGDQSISKSLSYLSYRLLIIILAIAALAFQPSLARPQSVTTPSDSSADPTSKPAVSVAIEYERTTQKTMARNYVFDAFGPYPIAASAMAAGANQFTNAPPEWSQGLKGYSRRLGSDFGIGVAGTTTRYAMAEVLHEDTMYYRCDCVGVLPRLRHAVFSTLTARRGVDGHRVFSFPALVAPYAGTMTAVYAWYPTRYGAKDAFRFGNYSMLAYVGSNISLEFLFSGPHSLLSSLHLNNAHGSPEQGPNK